MRAPTIRKLIAGAVAQMFDQRDLAEISSPDFPDERLTQPGVRSSNGSANGRITEKDLLS